MSTRRAKHEAAQAGAAHSSGLPARTFRRAAAPALMLLLTLLTCATEASARAVKYGLFVGINEYPSEDERLYGAVNDATKLRQALVGRFDFQKENTTLLTDRAATREAIISNLEKYARLAQTGDLFVFTYSGHGTLFPDAYSPELDEKKAIEMDVQLPEGRFVLPRGLYDSAIVPVDADDKAGRRSWRNLILDDELYDLFSAFTRKGAQVVFIADSCHSGTLSKAVGSQARVKFVSPLKVLKVESFAKLKAARPAGQKRVASRAKALGRAYLVLSGSKDDEFSLDVSGGSPDAGGLFTKTILSVIEKSETPLTYSQLMARVRPEVTRLARAEDNEQTPQLDTTYGNPEVRIFDTVVGRPH